MSRSPFDPSFEELPDRLAVFPLPGALLLPGGELPLNIFEPRYLRMVRDALSGDRLIGMIQPCEEAEDVGGAEIYRTGCAGRIVAFKETDDGRYLITLAGLIRFDIERELPPREGYRRVVPRFAPYRADLPTRPDLPTRADRPTRAGREEESREIDRPRLLGALGAYFDAKGLSVDWDAIEETDIERLITSLAMGCPFAPSEKQALLEARTLGERAGTMTAILEMSLLGDEEDAARH